MRIAALIFLWVNRLYFTGVVLYGVHNWRQRRDAALREYSIGPTIVAVWQIIGTFVVVILGISPFHLIWWYALGWVLYTAGNLIVKAITKRASMPSRM